MASDGSKLTYKQKRAIAALLCERDVESAAKKAKVGERTLYRWLAQDADFQAGLVQAEAGAIDAATRRLIGLQDSAISTLQGLLDNLDTSDSVRLRAAQSCLDYLLKLRELRNIEARLTALEQAINDKQT